MSDPQPERYCGKTKGCNYREGHRGMCSEQKRVALASTERELVEAAGELCDDLEEGGVHCERLRNALAEYLAVRQ